MSESSFDRWLDAPYRAQGEREDEYASEFDRLVANSLASLPEAKVTVPAGWVEPRRHDPRHAGEVDSYRCWLCSYVEGVAEDTPEQRRRWAETWAHREMEDNQ